MSDNIELLKAEPQFSIKEHEEPESEYRNLFERDRDRILYSKAFRRLSGKTQVFLSGYDDHLRTRLTHTIEVMQISKAIGKRLGLNLDLIEAIAFAHDIGHTPFGHIGERTLNMIMNGCEDLKGFNQTSQKNKNKGFKHNFQAIRIVCDLTKYELEHYEYGLNLTDYTLWGILNHSSVKQKHCKQCYFNLTNKKIEELKNFFIEMPNTILMKGAKRFSNDFLELYLLDKVKFLKKHSESLKPEKKDEFLFFIENSLLDSNNKTIIKCGLSKTNIQCRNKGDLLLKYTFYDKYLNKLRKSSWTIEALVVRIADEIAQRHHDIEDGLIAKIIDKTDLLDNLKKIFSFNEDEKHLLHKIENEDINFSYIPTLSKLIVNLLINKLVDGSRIRLTNFITEYNINSHEEFIAIKEKVPDDIIFNLVNYDEEFIERDESLQDLLKNRILNSQITQRMDGKSKFIITKIVEALVFNPQHLPDNTILAFYRNYNSSEYKKIMNNGYSYKKLIGELRNLIDIDQFQHSGNSYRTALLRTICDFIGGMTDSHATNFYESLYGTSNNKW